MSGPICPCGHYFSSAHPGWMAYWKPGMSVGDAVRRMLAEQEAAKP